MESIKTKKWDKRFLRVAREVASWSKDPSKGIGAVAVSDNRIIATGYNGFPSCMPDNSEWLSDPEVKRSLIIHAEMNLIMDASRTSRSLVGSTIYVYGLILCPDCMKHVIAAGVTRIVYVNLYNDPYWNEEWKKSLTLITRTNKRIEVVNYEPAEIDN
jgi:dCMP deaminase